SDAKGESNDNASASVFTDVFMFILF
ncbi:hypothetical protein MGSAQ_001441, partial [marine sediment metagenome]